MFKIFKRAFDFCSALALLLVISPVFLVLSIAVLIDMGWPIFFTQERSGKGMKTFKLMKFRSMNIKKDKDGNLLPDNLRVSKFGRMLRSSSLDELPELINIIKGDMSVIGPRPLPARYNEYFTEFEKNRFNVRGGLITPDSVDEKTIIPWDKQFDYEAKYALNLSLKEDVKIFFSVFRILFKRGGDDYGSYMRKPFDVERKERMGI